MKNYLLSALWVLLSISCGPPEFEKNTRILVIGSLVDENNIPISNAEIRIYTRRPTGIFDGNGSEFLLGKGLSSENGEFEVTSLFDRDEDFLIEIDGQDKFSNYAYSTNTKDYLSEDLVFNLQTVSLKKLSEVNYTITRASPSGTELRFSLKYKYKNCYEFFNEGILDPIKTNCFSDASTGRLLNDNNPDISSTFLTPLGTTVEFKYSIDNQPEVTETFIIDKENYEFEFSY